MLLGLQLEEMMAMRQAVLSIVTTSLTANDQQSILIAGGKLLL